MTTAVISDLHLGALAKRALAREPETIATLRERLSGVDHLVLLGDALELREAPLGAVLKEAEPFFVALGEIVGDGRVTLVPGNHDHHLAAPVLEAHRLNGGRPMPLDAEIPAPTTGAVGRLAEWLGGTELRLAYPGIWLREDVFALHGHYLDLHNTVPAIECVALSATERALGGGPQSRTSPDDYEAAIGPLYSLTYNLAQAGRRRITGGTSMKVWQQTGGADKPSLTGRLLSGVAIPGLVAGLNRAGLGPFRPELNGHALRRASLSAIQEVVGALQIDAQHVLFGHSHRSGPWPGDETSEWTLPNGGRLHNTGSWVVDPAFGPTGPYTPGPCAFLDEQGPPRLERLLEPAATRT